MLLRHLRDGYYTITPVDAPDIAVEPDATFEVDDPALARSLLEQDTNYAPADTESKAIADEIAAEREAHDEVIGAEDTAELTARELIASLPTLAPDELLAVKAQEQAGPGRKTVLARIDELLASAGPDGEA